MNYIYWQVELQQWNNNQSSTVNSEHTITEIFDNQSVIIDLM